MFFIVRHGERADMNATEQKKIINKHDPHLTDNGKLHAEQTGQLIKSFIQTSNQSLSQIIFLCSPFLRCISTAKHIMKGMEIESQIYIQDELCESLYDNYFSENPLPNLESKNNKIKGINNQHYINTNIEIKFPEFIDDVSERMINFIKELIKTKENNIWVLITHQRPVKCALEALQLEKQVLVDYCFFVTFQSEQDDPNTWKIINIQGN